MRRAIGLLVWAASCGACADVAGEGDGRIGDADGGPVADGYGLDLSIEERLRDAGSGGDVGADAAGEDAGVDAEVDAGPPEPLVAYTDDEVGELFLRRCSPCHIRNAEAGLNFRGAFLQAIVDVPSTQSRLPRVAPGDRMGSYIYLKLTGQQRTAGGRGRPMPSRGPIPADEIERFGLWIDALQPAD